VGRDRAPGGAGGSTGRGRAWARLSGLGAVATALALGWAVLFIAVGLSSRLQMFADGSMFSYAVAVQDAWAFHWHNIAVRSTVWLLFLAPAELVVRLTGDAGAGVALYGGLQFAAPLASLGLTFAFDHSPRRALFVAACGSTVCLLPLVFGFPTEMWAAHALFWPAYALSRSARSGVATGFAVFAAFTLLVLTHEGAIPLGAVIVALLALEGGAQARRGAAAYLFALAVWGAIKVLLPPDDYFGGIIGSAALYFIDLLNLNTPHLLLGVGALAAFGAVFFTARRFVADDRAMIAGLACAGLAVAAYWLLFEPVVNASSRYPLRSALLFGMPAFAFLAFAGATGLAARLRAAVRGHAARFTIGALLVLTFVHAGETAKFVSLWNGYRHALGELVMSDASDPDRGDGLFVSAARLDPVYEPVFWMSTTPYLSVLVAPGFVPRRLAIDAAEFNYYWLACETARANWQAARAVPDEARRMVMVHACLHR
ncbi:MAG: hypothetical protein O3A88_06135, partial [Proteobacteria bacterium]|nr:hypothetical protein [Pseudomonadota bacterium]